jgi:carbon monoxide dehydrogenase subunit G
MKAASIGRDNRGDSLYIIVGRGFRKMQFEGLFDTRASESRVYALVTDPREVAGCMPGLQKVDVRSPDEFDAVVRVGVSFIRGDFIMRFRSVGKEPASGARFAVHGTGLGSAVDMEIALAISPGKNGGASMRWEAKASVSGKVASLGQRIMEAQAEKIIREFFDCFRRKLEGS